MTTAIPQPPSVPFLGNVANIEREVPLRSFVLLAKTYGEIYELNVLGNHSNIISSHALVNEVSDEKRFQKRVGGGLAEVRNLVGDGLFTAQPEEPNWGIAHRLLMPAFGTLAVKNMMEQMRDIASQLLLKWERFGSDTALDPSDDFTRVAFDTISYCSMSYRMNSFYSSEQPEFIAAMAEFLIESGNRANRPRMVQAVMRGTNAKYESDMKKMKDLADKIVAKRRTHPDGKHDLLDTMLNSRDPKTGQGMTEQSIAQNLLTFLIAGHETSSGMLTFMVYYLLKNPEKMRKLRAQVDEVLGDRPVEYDDFDKLPYLVAVMRETLRLCPPAPIRSAASLEDTTIGNGKYALKKGSRVVILVWQMHRDPKVWGDDAEEFRPERMMDGKFEALPPNAWQPFGFGMRGCIGRAFAWQEVLLVMASIIQRFDLSLVDPSYTLQIKQTLTVKPKDLRIRASLRKDKTGSTILFTTPSSPLLSGRDDSSQSISNGSIVGTKGKKLYVLYGSNTGSSEAFAQRIANAAPSYGFRSTIGVLDSVTDKVPTDGPVVIITASYEGEPADNAAQFVDWLQNTQNNVFANVQFTVFGCGNSDWTKTYQRIPTLIDDLFVKRGAKRLFERGAGDAGTSGFFQVFDEWETGMWTALSKEYGTSGSVGVTQTLQVKTVDAGNERATVLRHTDALLGRVVENTILTKEGPVKRHLEFELPQGTTARAGDYVAILPQNPLRDVRRVLARFGLSNEEEVILSSVGPTSLPVGKPVKLSEVLTGYVELSQPATKRDLDALASVAKSESTQSYIDDLKANYNDAVQAKRLSVFAIIESHPDIDLAIGAFLQMLPSMRVRQYSISSSPLWNPANITITISVLDAPALSSATEVPFLGVGSNYLANLLPGDRVQMAVRPSAAAFHPPENPLTPVVMFCSGSGLAPMRGFIQERAAQKASGRDVGKMLLFFGCRSPEWDFLYAASDLKTWSEMGVVEVRPAFSRASELSEGCKYVQDRVWKDRADVADAYQQGALFFTCGSANVAKGVKKTLIDLIKSVSTGDEAEAAEKFETIVKGRYATDIFD
ncbi:Fatty acid hydroxylase [Mycena indigotica]|uniref:Fatty acid hydroxylase n=1 Tax=Mycena indigotica TaxID=2126181 RepID=A0A8H6WHL7_9AGAR|nr:Fatty acid hydroxylase [Mycena indigotica]KAF7312594.1 Fatty acid hydroxylase [Mycena indigotica]